MDTNFLDSVLSTESASEFLDNLAKTKDQAIAGAQEAKGQALEGISGGILATGGIIGKATGLSKIASQSTKQLTKYAGNKIAQYGNEAVDALKAKAGQTIDDIINSNSASAQNAIALAKPITSETSFGGEAGDTITRAGQDVSQTNPLSSATNSVDTAVADGKNAVQGILANAKNAFQSKVGGFVQQVKSAFSPNSGSASGVAEDEGSFADPSSTGSFGTEMNDVINKLASNPNPSSADYMDAMLKAQARGGYEPGTGLLKDNPAITSSASEEVPLSSSASSSASSSVQSGIADIQSKLNLQAGEIPNRFTGNVGKIQGLTSGSNSANGAVADAGNAVDSAVENASNLANSAVENAGSVVNGAVQGASTAVNSAVEGASTAVNSAVNAGSNAVSGLLSGAGNALKGAVQGASTAVKAGVAGASESAEGVVGSIAGGAVGDEIGGALTASGILAPLGGLIMLGSTLGTAIEGIKDLFEAHSHHSTPDLSGIPQPQMNFGIY